MSSTLTDLTAATTWSGTDLFYALVGGNSRKIAASKFLVGEASNVLSQVDSTTAQTFRVYRTFTDSSNYERLAFTSSSQQFEIKAETAGTGNDNISIVLIPAGDGAFRTINTVTWTNISIEAEAHILRTTGTAASGLGFKQTYYIENAAGEDTESYRLEIVLDDATDGSEDSSARIVLLKAGVTTPVFKLDAPATATQTGLQVYDVDNNALERVTVGAADSGGSGFKVLRIPN